MNTDPFPSKTIRLSGEKVLQNNIEACINLANEIKTTLGPCGMDRIIMDSNGGVLISNDGATILKYLPIEHPAAILLSQVSKSQDENVGDGTTSVILLAAELLKNSRKLTSIGYHTSSISYGYRKCCKLALKWIQELSEKILMEKDTLIEVINTCIGSKIIGIQLEHFSKIIVEAFLLLRNEKKISHKELFKMLNFEKVIGKNMIESEFFKGFLIQKEVSIDSPQKIENPKILISRLELGNFKPKVFGTKINVETLEEGNELSVFEREKLREVCRKIVELGINVVFNAGQVSVVAEEFLNSKGVICIGNVGFDKLEALSNSVGCPIATNLDNIKTLGSAKSVEQIYISDTPFIKIDGCELCTILLRAPTKIMLEESERSVNDALCALNTISKNQRVIGGGGSLYIEIAHRLRLESRENLQPIFDEFANSLECIPIIISQNGGFDSSSLLSKLRDIHKKQDGIWKGIDMKKGTIINTLEKSSKSISGVLEPSLVLESIIKNATDVSEMILRIDDNILIEPKKTPEELGIF